MKRKLCLFHARILLILTLLSYGPAAIASPAHAGSSVETIVLIRHGEKPARKTGQLTCRGLNRALKLPDVLIGKYGKPDYIFASNPSGKNVDSDSHIRPFVTIEPTAIKLGMPVNTQFGSRDIEQLQAELTRPMYAKSLIFVAWEHVNLDTFAQNMMKAYGGDPSIVPPWPGSDYDSIFVIRLTRSGSKTTATFTIDHEGLNDKLSDQYPVLSGS